MRNMHPLWKFFDCWQCQRRISCAYPHWQPFCDLQLSFSELPSAVSGPHLWSVITAGSHSSPAHRHHQHHHPSSLVPAYPAGWLFLKDSAKIPPSPGAPFVLPPQDVPALSIPPAALLCSPSVCSWSWLWATGLVLTSGNMTWGNPSTSEPPVHIHDMCVVAREREREDRGHGERDRERLKRCNYGCWAQEKTGVSGKWPECHTEGPEK